MTSERLRPARWSWWIVGLLLGATLYFARPGPGRGGAGALFWVFAAFVAGLIGLLAVLVLLVLIRPRHGSVRRALRIARSGRVETAIGQLQRQIETRGPSPQRSSALGDCYLLLEQWRQAYIQYLDAERADGRRGRYLAKQGFALWKLGRASEAAPLLEQANAVEPLNPSHAWTSCLILADLGRYDEAREQLRRAELLFENGIPRDAARRVALAATIDACRKRLEVRPDVPAEPPLDPP